METQEFLQELRDILAQKQGIFPLAQTEFENTNGRLQLIPAEFAEDINASFFISPVKISDLKNRIADYKNEILPGNKKLSHAGFNYGLETNGNQHQVKLVVTGVRLDDSPDADLTVLDQDQVSSTQFFISELAMANGQQSNTARDNEQENFINFFTPKFSDGKIVQGAYIRLNDLNDALLKFEQEGSDQLLIACRFMKAVGPDDWNCFHLIFRGLNSTTNALSGSIFSTFDGEDGYSGPKPGRPPFETKSKGSQSK